MGTLAWECAVWIGKRDQLEAESSVMSSLFWHNISRGQFGDNAATYIIHPSFDPTISLLGIY